jgi:hypothetical protein
LFPRVRFSSVNSYIEATMKLRWSYVEATLKRRWSYVEATLKLGVNGWILMFMLTRPSRFAVSHAVEKFVSFCWILFYSFLSLSQPPIPLFTNDKQLTSCSLEKPTDAGSQPFGLCGRELFLAVQKDAVWWRLRTQCQAVFVPERMQKMHKMFYNSLCALVGNFTAQSASKLNSMVWVRERTIPTERPPLVGEVSANFFADRGCHVVNVTDPYGRILGF